MPSASFSSSRNFRRSKRKSNRNNSDPNEPPNSIQIPGGAAEQSETTQSRSASTATTSSSLFPAASELASSTSAAAANSSSTSSNCHQSPPYDLRKKFPTTTTATNNGSESNSNSNWPGTASTSIPSSTVTSSGSTGGSSSSGLCCGGSSSHAVFTATSNTSASSNNSNQYQLCTYDSSQPAAKKRPRRSYSSTESSTTLSAHYLQVTLPDEVILTIFSYLSEFDLCRVSLVCKRFNIIANDCELWKRLYQEVFEYDLPLMNPEPCKFSFVKVDDSEFSNPWKESFHQLHHGIHVRPNYVDKKGRNLAIFNTIQSAIEYADEKNTSITNSGSVVHASGSSSSSNNFDMMVDNDNVNSSFIQESPYNLIFVHTGIYRGEFLVIDSDLKLIGASPGNIAENIIIESESESTQSTVTFTDGAKNAYIGYMTLKFSPADVTNAVPHHKHYCLEIGENCSPTVDHCIIRSNSVGKLSKDFFLAEPFIRCVVGLLKSNGG